jgi:hypothetical protein
MIQNLCNGLETINKPCPNRLICSLFLDFEISKGMKYSINHNYVSGFECSNKDYINFKQFKPTKEVKLIALSNGMIIRERGKHQKADMQVFRVLIPHNHRAIVYDGTSFFTTDNITTLEPVSEIVGVTII